MHSMYNKQFSAVTWRAEHCQVTFQLSTTGSFHVNEHSVALTETEYWVMFYLIWHAPRVRPMALLYRDVHGSDPYDEQSIKVHVSRIKAKVLNVDSTAAQLLQWVRGRGPRLSEAEPYAHSQWDYRQKKKLLDRLENNEVSLEDVLNRYPDMHSDEIRYWQHRRRLLGEEGLKINLPLYTPRKHFV